MNEGSDGFDGALKYVLEGAAGLNDGCDVVRGMFSLATSPRVRDVIVGGRRVLVWDLQGSEADFAELAGWSQRPCRLDARKGCLRVPKGTRNARSLLSGLEAYTGEKAAVVRAARDYFRRVATSFRAVDVHFGWASMAVTPDNDLFVAPPHVTVAIDHAEVVGPWGRRSNESLRCFWTAIPREITSSICSP
jgi:hypothetical protein